MKKLKILMIVIGILISALPATTSDELTGQVSFEYTFDRPLIEEVRIEDIVYSRVIMNNAPNCGNTSEPSLPAKGVSILIPRGKEVSNITISHGEKISLGSSFLVEPVGEPIIPSLTSSYTIPKTDETIYSSDDMFPGELFTEVGTYFSRGYEILVLRLNPVQYKPLSGELIYYPNLSISVETVIGGIISTISPLFRSSEKDEIHIMNLVDNPSNVDSYGSIMGCGSSTRDSSDSNDSAPPSPLGGDYRLLIITSDELQDGFIPLKDAHDNESIKTLIYTVDDIYDQYTEDDNAEKIRNFIIDAYKANSELEYVLLGGDHDIVPSKYLYNDLLLDPILSDQYYAGLDGTWNDRSEKPNPSDKDLSINDPGVSCYCEGQFSGPFVDYSNSIVGDSSMLLNCNPTVQEYWSSLYLTFNNPKDLSDYNWLNLCINYSRSDISQDLPKIRLYDTFGLSTSFIEPSHIFSSGSWETQIIRKVRDYSSAGSRHFNFKRVKKIRIEFRLSEDITDEDFIRLDGIYFSKFSNSINGEPGEEDFYAEVFVGRACVDNPDDVQNFTSKTIAYINTTKDDEYLRKISMVGEHLGFSVPFFSGYNMKIDWGGNFLDDLVGKCSKYDYTTKGFPINDDIFIDKLYDRNWKIEGWPKPWKGKYGWSKYDIIDRINNDIHIINHVGHGNEEHNMKMDNPDIVMLNNDKYCFIYSQGCSSGYFDNNEQYSGSNKKDCIAEHFTVKTSNGAFAGIWNTRYGIAGSKISDIFRTDGPSQRYNREFWDAVFNENITTIGKANQDSKEDNLWRKDSLGMRYLYLTITLFGDPAVQFKYLDSSIENHNNQNS